jgi:hypothetical protein
VRSVGPPLLSAAEFVPQLMSFAGPRLFFGGAGATISLQRNTLIRERREAVYE